MIDRVRGRVLRCDEDVVVVECGGIGLRVRVIDPRPYGKMRGREVRIPVWLEIQPRRLTLYGFRNERERDRFSALVGIPGIGPASALRLLPFHEQLIKGEEVPAIPGFGNAKRERVARWLKRPPKPSAVPEVEKELRQGLVTLGLSVAEARIAAAKALKARPRASLEELLRVAVRKR